MTIPSGIRRARAVMPFMFAAISTSLAGGLAPAPAAAGPVTIAEYTFDDGLGGPDAQGWVPYHRFATKSPHFHVEDFSGVGHEAALSLI